jgi:hypothetical protein
MAMHVERGRQQQRSAMRWRLGLLSHAGDSTARVDCNLNIALPPLGGKPLFCVDYLQSNNSVDFNK